MKIKLLALVAMVSSAYIGLTAAYMDEWHVAAFCAVLTVMCYLFADSDWPA